MNMIEYDIAMSGRADPADKALVAEVTRLLRSPSFLASHIFDFLAPSACRERTQTVALLAHGNEISNRIIPTKRLQDAANWYHYAVRNVLEYVLIFRAREKAACQKKAA